MYEGLKDQKSIQLTAEDRKVVDPLVAEFYALARKVRVLVAQIEAAHAELWGKVYELYPEARGRVWVADWGAGIVKPKEEEESGCDNPDCPIHGVGATLRPMGTDDMLQRFLSGLLAGEPVN